MFASGALDEAHLQYGIESAPIRRKWMYWNLVQTIISKAAGGLVSANSISLQNRRSVQKSFYIFFLAIHKQLQKRIKFSLLGPVHHISLSYFLGGKIKSYNKIWRWLFHFLNLSLTAFDLPVQSAVSCSQHVSIRDGRNARSRPSRTSPVVGFRATWNTLLVSICWDEKSDRQRNK